MSFTDEELALINAIHADPKNDAPRLAYADWCETHDLANVAEFIRNQCREPYFKLDTGNGVVRLRDESSEVGQKERVRVDRAIELLSELYGTPRYPKLRHRYWEEYVRGIPVYQDEFDDAALVRPWDELIRESSPLARFDLTIITVRVAMWLAHPLMLRTDRLQIEAAFAMEAKPDPDLTMNSHHDRFWAENIPVLAASSVIDRLEELNPCGCDSTGVRTAQSTKNLALCRDLLEPRVYVRYDW